MGLSDTATPQQAALVARRAAQAALSAMTAAVLAARAAARLVASQQVAGEVAEASAVWGGPLPTPRRVPSEDIDRGHAEVAGASYASAWLALALLAIAVWDRKGRLGPVASVVTTVTRTIGYRVERIVTTETARAHTDEHRTQWKGLVKAAPRMPWAKAVRRWDARLDKIVCSRCRAHESEETTVDGEFRGGDEPGEIHVSCRCIATTIVMPLGANEVIGINATSPAPYVTGAGEAA